MKLIAVFAGLLALGIIGFGLFRALSGEETRPPESITVEEATVLFEEAYEASLELDIESLCDLGGSQLSCQGAWRTNGEWAAVPDEQPTVVYTRTLPDQKRDNGSVYRGGRLLKVSGVDGLGRSFVTDFLVFDEGGGRLVALNPVYWTGVKIYYPPAAIQAGF